MDAARTLVVTSVGTALLASIYILAYAVVVQL